MSLQMPSGRKSVTSPPKLATLTHHAGRKVHIFRIGDDEHGLQLRVELLLVSACWNSNSKSVTARRP